METPQAGPELNGNTVSACIVCRNEADKLEPCLESIRWVDEIVVMDLQSVDGSGQIAREHGARVISRAPHPIVEPLRNELVSVATGEWILALDPDERVSPGLADYLREVAYSLDCDAIVIPRMNFDLGYAPSNRMHRYEPQIRMYRRSRVSWPLIPNTLPDVPENRLHRVPLVDELALVHDRSRNIPEILERSMRYAPAEAQAMIDSGRVFSAWAMLGAMASTFRKQFILGRPWEDGVPGMLRASLLLAFKFYVWAAFWQLSGARRTQSDDRLVRRIGLLLRSIGLLLKVLERARSLAYSVRRVAGVGRSRTRSPKGTPRKPPPRLSKPS